MKKFLQKIFNLYPGEGKNAIIFSLLAFFWSFAITSGHQFSYALFLLHVGAEYLPTVYGLTAFAMLVMALGFLQALHRLGTYRSYRAIVFTGVLFYAFATFAVWSGWIDNGFWFWYLLKISTYLIFSLGLTSFWTFVDEYYDIRDAKRMYTLFISMIFLGGILTGVIMRSAFLRLESLFPLLLLIFSIAFVFITLIHKKVPLFIHEENEQETVRSGQTFAFPSLVKSIFFSKVTLFLLAGNFLMQLLFILTEFNYLSAFDQYFAALRESPVVVGEGTEALLTKFLGQLIAFASLINLFFGFFLYSRIVRYFGLGALLPISPLLLLFVYSMWFTTDSLFVPVLAFFVIESSVVVIDDNNFNLLLHSVPSKLKYKIRVAIESFFEPIGMLLSSFMLSFFSNESKMIAFILTAIWIIVVFTIRSEYLKGIFQNLSENTIRFSRSIQDWIEKMPEKQQKAAEYRLLSIIKYEETEEKLLASKALFSLEDSNLLQKMLPLIKNLSTEGKKRFIPLVEESFFALHPEIFDLFEVWLREESDDELTGMIQFYFAKHGFLLPEKILFALRSSSILSRAAAIAALKKSGSHLPPSTLASNRTIASQALQNLLTSSNSEEICMGLRIVAIDAPPSDIDLLMPFLRYLEVDVARCAAEAIYSIIDKTCRRQAEAILEFLNDTNDHEVRIFCLKAIGKIGDSAYGKEMILKSTHFRPSERRLIEKMIVDMGLKTVPMLLSILKDAENTDRSRVLAGRILGRLALPQLRANLSEIIHDEIERAYFYFYHAHTIQQQHPDLDLSILVETLHNDYQSVIDFVIQLLAVSGEVEDEELLSKSLRSRNPKIRSQAVEAIEKTCEPKIFLALEALIEDIPTSEKIRIYEGSHRKPWNLNDLLDKLDVSPSQTDQMIAAMFKYRLNLPGWRESLRKKMSSQEEIFHHFAYELLET